MSRISDFLLDLIFPNRCPFCDRFIKWDGYICPECAANLEQAEFCPKCGHAICQCSDGSRYYDGCAVARPYTGLVRKGILSLKYHNGFNAAKLLVPEAVRLLDKNGFIDEDAIVTAVPMTKQRRRQTGYNHAEYIAKLISKQTALKCDFQLISKRRSAPTQHELSAKERKKALSGVYSPREGHKDISGRAIILCDDIITTGSTLDGCAKVLKEMGAKKVYCAVLGGTGAKSVDKGE